MPTTRHHCVSVDIKERQLLISSSTLADEFSIREFVQKPRIPCSRSRGDWLFMRA